MSPSSAVLWVWAIGVLSWLIAASWSNRTEASPPAPLRTHLISLKSLVCCFCLLLDGYGRHRWK